MVRLSMRSLLHLLPEQVGPDFEHPFYANVTRLDGDEVTFCSLEGGSGSVSRDVAAECILTASEVYAAGQLSFLRRSVSMKVNDRVSYGQVVSVIGGEIKICSGGNELVSRADDISAVPPVVALLVERMEFQCSYDEDIENLQIALLGRELGNNGEATTNNIAAIFDGLMRPECFPSPDQLCSWADPRTGATTKFHLQHAVDFAFFADGNRNPVPDHVGETFCRPPEPPSPDETNRTAGSAMQLFYPFLDDDVLPQDNEMPVAAAFGSQPTPSGRRSCGRNYNVCTPATGRLSKISVGFGQGCSHSRQTRRRSRASGTSEVRAVTERGADSELLPKRHKSDPTSKYSFNPQPDQQYVHDRITSEKHRGKSPYLYVCGLVRSDSVKFKALPGSLSIRHFARFAPEGRVKWLQAGGSNFDNLSATAKFYKATPAASIDDVVDSARVFLTYAWEYCYDGLIELVEAILRFIEETLMRVTWNETELPSVVYWVNDVLEDFREAVESDGDVKHVLLRCSTEGRLLRDLIFARLHRQVDALRKPKHLAVPRGVELKAPTAHKAHLPRESSTGHGRMPKTVLKRLPTQVDADTGERRSLCMRFLSKAGCQEVDGGCPSDRGHFVPKQLPDIVKVEIKNRFGGLKTEYQQL
ncbi:LOW QUALITY PROTEIN: hypothetical protein PHMEG_00020615 [Phytophthora megakarya]|uniref:Uncharacterized protein n=1 Tax=Phytophthora megakarya TaxID=4795 RepID=A0A225VNX4_9STRA|nr:LOW QUALITY PROTEIN: hypothetical protein PHMEG_00020615 [Phytophthora megakarya]